MQLSRAPLDARLAPWVARLWLHEADAAPQAARELCLPSACTRLVMRLQGAPMRRFQAMADTRGVVQPRFQCCGLRRFALLRSPADMGLSVGVDLRPGATQAVFGMPADRLAGQYVALDALMPVRLRDAFRALQGLPAGSGMLDRLEELLVAWWSSASTPEIAPQRFEATLAAVSEGVPILRLAATSGISHRAWLAQFRAAVGCTPREWRSLACFTRALQVMSRPVPPSLAELASAAGYHDQAHMTRSFVAHAGITPGAYRNRRGLWPQHLPVH